MSAETKYKCDVCRGEIKSTALEKGEAFAMKWTTNGNLDLGVPWWDMPLHICNKCLEAIVEFSTKRTKQ